MAESPVICRRPLEPDAGNAAEGSEESEPDWRIELVWQSAMRFPAHGDEYELKPLSF